MSSRPVEFHPYSLTVGRYLKLRRSIPWLGRKNTLLLLWNGGTVTLESVHEG